MEMKGNEFSKPGMDFEFWFLNLDLGEEEEILKWYWIRILEWIWENQMVFKK